MPRVNERYSIEGAESLKRIFEELPKAVATKVARRVLYRGALPIRDHARSAVPVQFGALKKAIIVRTGQELEAAGVGTRVDGSGNSVSYTKFARTGNIKVYITIDNRYYEQVTNKDGRKRIRAIKKGAPVGPKNRRIYPRKYAHLVEFGTAPHFIGEGSEKYRFRMHTYVRGRKRGVTAKVERGGFERGRMHPGSRPKPFMEPAFITQSDKSIAIIVREAESEIDKEVQRLRAKGNR